MESAQICLELRYLVYTSILLLVLWMPYILVQLFGVGPGKALSYPEDGVAAPKWTSRWKRAHYNLVENIVPFAVAVTAGELLNIHNGVTAACAMIFFWARVVHPFAQALNIITHGYFRNWFNIYTGLFDNNFDGSDLIIVFLAAAYSTSSMAQPSDIAAFLTVNYSNC